MGQTEQNESGGAHRLTLLHALIPSASEIRYLLARLILKPPTGTAFILAWSLWRRQHQCSAAIAHYKRRANAQL